jgi:hypothetical protein
MKPSLLTSLNFIQSVCGRKRAYFLLAYKKEKGIERLRSLGDAYPYLEAETTLAQVQSQVSQVAAWLWNSIYYTDVAKDFAQADLFKKAAVKIINQISLKEATEAIKEISRKARHNDPELSALVETDSFLFYAGIKKVNELQISIPDIIEQLEAVKATNVEDPASVDQTLQVIGRNQSFDLQGIWSKIYIQQPRLN